MGVLGETIKVEYKGMFDLGHIVDFVVDVVHLFVFNEDLFGNDLDGNLVVS